MPSTSIRPESPYGNAQTRLMIVDLPDPDDPTSAVTVPGFDSKLIPCSTGLPVSYSNSHILELHVAHDVLERLDPCRLGELLFLSLRISVVRSSPATASVSCVPMFTIWTTGAIMNASNMRDTARIRRPSCGRPERSCAPRYITSPPTTPSTVVDASVIRLFAVSDLITLSSSRFTPPANTPRFPLLRVVSLHHPHAAQRLGQPPRHLSVDLRPLTEDRPDGPERLLQNQPERPDHENINSVIRGARCIRKKNAMTAVITPPTNSTSPVPTRLRTPSTSVMMRDTSMPVRFSS